MISIKKFLDQRLDPHEETNRGPANNSIESYRSALLAFSKNAVRDGSAHGEELASKLVGLDRRIRTKPSVESIREAQVELEINLDLWGERAAADAKSRVVELKEALLALAGAAEAIGVRDERNAKHLSKLTGDLENVGNLNEIREIRSTLVQHVTVLRASIEEMAQESHEMLSFLQDKVAVYEAKVKNLESMALTDLLTGLANRRSLEERINANIERGILFCVVLFDLNRFKQINDCFGHYAGDDILKQFAARLKENCRASDLIGRWGGDEFVVVVSGEESKIAPIIYRLRSRACGRYIIRRKEGTLDTLEVDAAVGIAQWMPGDTQEEVISRADQSMYEDKKRMKALVWSDGDLKSLVVA